MWPLPRLRNLMEGGGNFGHGTPNGFAEARQEMVETQIRKRHITDGRVLECLAAQSASLSPDCRGVLSRFAAR